MDLVSLLEPGQFVVVTFLTLLLPVYVLFVLFVVRKGGKWGSRAGRRLVLGGLGALAVCACVLYGVAAGLQALAALTSVMPALLPFAVRVQRVAFAAPQPAGYHRFNPAVVALGGGRAHVAALRESTLYNCAEAHHINVRSDNRVLVGASTTGPAGAYRLCTVYARPDLAAGSAHRGYQDGRLFPLGRARVAGGEVAARLGITLAVYHSMHVGELAVRVDPAGTCHVAHLREPVPVHLRGTPIGTKQKNWMHIPPIGDSNSNGNNMSNDDYDDDNNVFDVFDENGSGNEQRKQEHLKQEQQLPRFVQWINPLTVVALNTSTGEAEVVARAPHSAAFSDRLRGNTNFLRHPREPHRLFALVHYRDESRALVVVPYYTSAVLEIREHPNGTYTLAGVSRHFRLPTADNATTAHRIHFPMSLAYADASMREIDIAMGYMDCTPHIVTVRTDDFIHAVESAAGDPPPIFPSRTRPFFRRKRS